MTMQVGYSPTRAELQSLPIGSRVRGNNSNLTRTKISPHTWQRDNDRRAFSQDGMAPARFTIVHIADPSAVVPAGLPALQTPITERGTVVSLPVGTVITFSNGDPGWVKVGINQWRRWESRDREGEELGDDRISIGGGHRIYSYPDTRPAVGTPLNTREEIQALPVGVWIGPEGSRDHFVKQSNGDWELVTGTGRRVFAYTDTYFTLGGHNCVLGYEEVNEGRPPIGTLLANREEIAALPVGVQIGPNPNRLWTQVGPGSWINPEGRAYEGNFTPNYNYVQGYDGVVTPATPSTLPAVGEPVGDQMMLDSMPEGTVIRYRDHEQENYKYRKVEDQWARLSNGERFGPGSFTGPRWVVHSYPDGTTPPIPVPTLKQFQWKFRNIAIKGARDHAINMNDVEDTLHQMGVSQAQFEFVPGLTYQAGQESQAHDDLPNGSLIQIGKDPADFANYGLFVRANTGWQHLMGGQTAINRGFVITRVGPDEFEGTSWVHEEGDANAEAEINMFKSRAWRIGSAAKARYGWCGSFEDIMRQAGITAASAMIADDIFPAVTVDEARGLPEGSLIIWQSRDNPALWCIYQRQDGATNRMGTRRVARSGAAALQGFTAHYAYNDIRLLARAGEEFALDITGADFGQLPPGADVVQGGYRYRMCEDLRTRPEGELTGDATPATGRHDVHAHGGETATFTLVRIPMMREGVNA